MAQSLMVGLSRPSPTGEGLGVDISGLLVVQAGLRDLEVVLLVGSAASVAVSLSRRPVAYPIG